MWATVYFKCLQEDSSSKRFKGCASWIQPGTDPSGPRCSSRDRAAWLGGGDEKTRFGADPLAQGHGRELSPAAPAGGSDRNASTHPPVLPRQLKHKRAAPLVSVLGKRTLLDEGIPFDLFQKPRAGVHEAVLAVQGLRDALLSALRHEVPLLLYPETPSRGRSDSPGHRHHLRGGGHLGAGAVLRAADNPSALRLLLAPPFLVSSAVRNVEETPKPREL